jgi:hypothetical protein
LITCSLLPFAMTRIVIPVFGSQLFSSAAFAVE